MSQVNSVKDLRNKHAKCLARNRDRTPYVDIKSRSYSRPRTTITLVMYDHLSATSSTVFRF